MSNDDSLFGSGDADRTILKPTPGGRRPGRPGGAPRAPAGPAPAPRHDAGALRAGHGINALVDAAEPLLALAAELRATMAHPDPMGLCEHVMREIQAFETAARSAGVAPESVLAARYALCTFIDEIVLATPWGSESGWASQSLLLRFHKEGWGGEKFFKIVERLSGEPARNADLLELLYLCLALGFEGKFKVQERGAAALERVREDLYELLRRQRGEYEPTLSAHWRGVEDVRSRLARFVPLWVFGAAAGVVLLGAFIGMRVSLHRVAEPVQVSLHQLAREEQPLVSRETGPPPVTDLGGFLASEVAQGLVEVSERPGETRIRIAGTGLFGSGSAIVSKGRLPLLERIAAALQTVEGRVLVTGHTDSDPIPGSLRLKYASNWELSQKRAQAVLDVLGGYMGSSGRLEAEGRADTEPLAPNDSRANKALNRRVEILLKPRAGKV